MIKRAVIQPQELSTADDVDLDLGELAPPYPLIPPGEYDVVFVKAHPMNIFKGTRLITYWKIQDLSNEYHGTVLILGFQFPKKGKKWGPLSKLAQCYRIATSHDPGSDDIGQLSINVFKNKLFRAQVRTVTEFNDPKSRKRVKRSPENYYSVIETLLALKMG